MNKKNTKPDIAKPKELTKKQKKIQLGCFAVMLVIPLLIFIYIKTNPLVFNESWLEHSHCMAQVYNALRMYSDQNDGNFPYSKKGYADSLGMASDHCYWIVTGPCYKVVDPKKFADIPESKCGRVYIQGLKESDDCNLVFLFDKKATPGGDHCHLPQRIWAPLGREVLYITCQKDFIPNDKWDAFAKEQIELLVKTGIPREKAEWYYNQIDK